MADPENQSANQHTVHEGLADVSRWYSTNLIGIPTALLASTEFNQQPHSITIHGTREAHPSLFRLLNEHGHSQEEAAEVFVHYMDMVFGLEKPDPNAPRPKDRRFHASYLKLLQGWGFDSNSAQGAVLKGWVESRFGLVPTFHKEPLQRFPSPSWMVYLEEKMGSRFHNNCINMQLDALYEYCQWSLLRFGKAGLVRLWRGTNSCEEQIVEGKLRDRVCVMRMNNLLSFSQSAERASEFGDWVLETEIPTCKLLFFPGLLNDRVLNGEGEALVIGGLFQVKASY